MWIVGFYKESAWLCLLFTPLSSRGNQRRAKKIFGIGILRILLAGSAGASAEVPRIAQAMQVEPRKHNMKPPSRRARQTRDLEINVHPLIHAFRVEVGTEG